MFDRVIAIDWSGRKDAQGQRNGIWACQGLINPDGCCRILEPRSGRTRDEIVNWLVGLAAGGGRLLVGIDFAFSLPQGYVAQQMGITAETWADVVQYCREHGENILRDCPPPFWGAKGTRRPDKDEFSRFGLKSLKRVTEQATPRAQSAFLIAGGGQVGTAALRGIPYLGTLREQGFRIWPFDGPPDTSDAAPIVVEIYPRVFSPTVTKSDRAEREVFLSDLRARGEEKGWLRVDNETLGPATASDDAFDALVSVAEMCRELTTPGLGFGRYSLDFYSDPLVRVEGWIWGVTYHTQ